MEAREMVMFDTVANATCSMTDIDAKAVEPAETAAKKRADFSFVNNIFGTLSEDVLKNANAILKAANREARKNKVQDMSLEEINAEIRAYREGR